LQHLARYATTEAGLRRVLERRIERWARAAEMERDAAALAAATARQAPK
jgi:regulatory protein